MSTEPRFTEDEIQQWNKEAMQIYHAENIALAEKVTAWQALGRELKYAFGITTVEDSIYLEYRTGAFGQVDDESYTPDELNSANERRYKALKRLLELTSE